MRRILVITLASLVFAFTFGTLSAEDKTPKTEKCDCGCKDGKECTCKDCKCDCGCKDGKACDCKKDTKSDCKCKDHKKDAKDKKGGSCH